MYKLKCYFKDLTCFSEAEKLAKRADAALSRGKQQRKARLATAKAAMAASKEGWDYDQQSLVC